ncbi:MULTISPECIES: DUF3140 domain-containing protein [Streptomyces]|jgi:hypothetical protein|uniref:DUF3140 domain-containing protein n=1 Tax=Streptomyces radiopugnans TaxID=403935 RepID=A0A1H9B1W9_9ACTN|nr:DUF3140 domain-containing protein [Streptomyces radiopugnans]URN13657.1 DUF3140 domain-containing protein [Streptomyces radiopugnans]SEP82663.1 Protein of unknown function [Streptomyces radiopugnans]
MADISELELDALWDEFHAVVNMTSNELEAWLRTSVAGERAEELPEQAGSERGRQVLAILRKRRTDLTDDDVAVMREVVDTVSAERERVRVAEAVRDSDWRHRMMSLGHDPVRAS